MIYDYVIIGSGLAGLTIAHRLSQESSKVLVVEAADQMGGWLSRPHLPFVPGNMTGQSALQNLENLLNLKIAGETLESNPLTFDSSELKPFLGFGEKTPEFYDEISYYCHPKKLELKLNPSEWISQLLAQYKGQFVTRSIVTKFLVEDGKVQSIMVNGSKKISAHNFIFCGDIKDLERLIPQEFNSPKTRTKISKTKTWSRATLVLDHKSEVTDSSQIHILVGSAQEEVVTCVGQFQKSTSTWTTFVADEDAEDPEITAQALKHIKRQIKRAYPNSFPDQLTEKIVVQSGFGGHFDVKLNANLTWPDLDNLWMGSSGFHSERNILGALQQSWLVLASLGFAVESPIQDGQTLANSEV